MTRAAVLALCVGTVSGQTLEQTPTTKGGTVATVGTLAITDADLAEFARDRLLRLRAEEYSIKRSALEELIALRLVSLAAAQRGISPLELQAEVEKGVGPVTDEQVKAVYESNPGQFRGQSEEKALAAIGANLMRTRLNTARLRFIDRIREQNRVTILLEPFRFSVSSMEAPAKGPSTAPVTIVAFSDFQCSHCAKLAQLLDKVRGEYGDRIRVEHRDFSILQPHSKKAAEAGRCAAEQGKFWVLHDAMFANQQSLAVPDIKRFAESVGIDSVALDACIESGRAARDVARDIADGRKFGVSATPTVFVNGRLVPGGGNPEAISRVIAEELVLTHERPPKAPNSR